jgi:ferredoxin-type protein NapH
LTASAALLAILIAPVLGGWQRMDRNYLAAWDGHGWDIPAWLLAVLPMGEAPARAHELNLLRGGGTGVEYFGLGMVDPVAGAMALSAGGSDSPLVWLAWGIPVLLAILAGRVFCGWLCPFGVLSRGLEWVLERLPFSPPRFDIPQRRWLRFVVLGGGLVGGAFTGLSLMYLFLPYLLVQSSVYSMWLMGGGGASVGALGGLLLAGVFFGPTAYCATLCPTGGALNLLGLRRPVHLTIVQPASCGAGCDLCDHACWLSLKPATGAPGPDCDLCGRCAEVCPKDNLGLAREPHLRASGRGASLLAALLAIVLGGLASPANASASSPEDPVWMRPRPKLVLEEARVVDDVDVWISVRDLNGVRRDADALDAETEIEISVYLGRGEPGAVDVRGKMSPREEIYTGPITLTVHSAASHPPAVARFERPNYPVSTPNRSIYRRAFELELAPGDRIVLDPVPGWTHGQTEWTVAKHNNRTPARTWAAQTGVAFIFFSGLLMLALGPLAKRRPAVVGGEDRTG